MAEPAFFNSSSNSFNTISVCALISKGATCAPLPAMYTGPPYFVCPENNGTSWSYTILPACFSVDGFPAALATTPAPAIPAIDANNFFNTDLRCVSIMQFLCLVKYLLVAGTDRNLQEI